MPPEVGSCRQASPPTRFRLGGRPACRTSSFWDLNLGAGTPVQNNMRELYGQIRARGETAGAPPIDPKILLGLWVYATSDGVGSGRDLARLVELHAAYRWLAGGVDVAYHCLNDFRGVKGGVFDQLVTQVLARLLQHDLLDLHRVAQDGTRIRASAGAGSFRRGETLVQLMAEARAHLAKVMRDASDPALAARRAASIKRAAQDRLARLEVPGIDGEHLRERQSQPRARRAPQERAPGGSRPIYHVRSPLNETGRRRAGFIASLRVLIGRCGC